MMFRRMAAVVVTAAVVLGGAITAKATALEAERIELVAQAGAVGAQAGSAQARGGYLVEAIARAEDEHADREAVIAVRPAFVTELEALADALSKAEGKIDTASHRAAVISAQKAVIDERKDPQVVTNATATVHAITDKVNGEVTTWEASQVQLAGVAGPLWSSSGPDGYARVRAALDRVGGAGVGLYESSSCAGGSAPACANSNGYIKYRADIAGWSDGRLNWAMAHELAHIHQFRVWGALNASGSYHSLFGGDPEFLANCMALVRGYAGSVGCNAEQQAWASGVWVGAVR